MLYSTSWPVVKKKIRPAVKNFPQWSLDALYHFSRLLESDSPPGDWSLVISSISTRLCRRGKVGLVPTRTLCVRIMCSIAIELRLQALGVEFPI